MTSLIDLLVGAIFHGAYMFLLSMAFSTQCIEFSPLLFELYVQSVALVHQVQSLRFQLPNERLTFAQLHFGLGQVGSNFGHVRLGFGKRNLPQLALLGQRRLLGKEGVLFLGKGGASKGLSVRDGKTPHLGKRLPCFGRNVGQLDHLLQSLRQRATPHIQHARHRVRRAGAERLTNLLHRWFITGGDERVRGGVDLLLRDAFAHFGVSSIGALP